MENEAAEAQYCLKTALEYNNMLEEEIPDLKNTNANTADARKKVVNTTKKNYMVPARTVNTV